MRDLEANLQYEYMDKVRGYVKQQEEQIGRPLTFYVKTFGCQMNARDSEKLVGILENIGYVEGEDEHADFVVYNTCTVRENANNKVYGRLGQLKKYKNKFRAEQQAGAASLRTDFIEAEPETDDEEIKIVRTKKFDIKPMYAEDACIQMELLGHDFYVFCNAETDQVNVVYKRKGNTYGLIEPEL